MSSFFARVPVQVWTFPAVSHTSSGSRGLGQLQKLFPREPPVLLSRFGCSCCQAEDRRAGTGWCVELAGVLSASFSSFLLFPSLCTKQNQSNVCFPRQRGCLSFLTTQTCYLCSDSKGLSHGTEYPICRIGAQKSSHNSFSILKIKKPL